MTPAGVRAELRIRCELYCCCFDEGCTACELRRLVDDLPALLKLADDRCACEQGRPCRACSIARPGPADSPLVREALDGAWRALSAAPHELNTERTAP